MLIDEEICQQYIISSSIFMLLFGLAAKQEKVCKVSIRGTLTWGIGGKVWIKHMLECFGWNFSIYPSFENGSYFDKCFVN